MFSTDFISRQQENLVENQNCQDGFRPLCNKISTIPGQNGIWVKFYHFWLKNDGEKWYMK